MKAALVTGITGQDGGYLAKLLLTKGYKVIGTHRRSSAPNFWRIEELGILNHENLALVEYDVTDPGSAIRLIDRCEPNEIYNLAAQSFVASSFEQPVTTAEITGIGPLHLLEAIRVVNRKIRFYQASTSEMFGEVQSIPQVEETSFYPRSPYGCAKLFAHWSTVNYRESYDIFGCSGILFNHESPLRGLEFVTRKITDGIARIRAGKASVLELGNLNASRDWGFAGEYVEGMWRMLQCEVPDTYVLATNRTTTVRDFVQMSARHAGINLVWSGSGVDEVGVNDATGDVLVRANPKYFRPAEVDMLVGDPSKAREKLGWCPSTTVEQLSRMMVMADLRRHAVEPASQS
ncbi:GDP-mannose 4,6-dehydratase [Burkholderia cepacia]|uniref:GDP-mannose 4,6-dehydratase n=1 Tax=Burkholderia cepacia TaxID=292 RepID=UPI0018669584|nr:GDP-mannose 4,6-dehydratase [Burkholderia cepacia]MBE2968026.1 GDP-mannose 4,6-dehydratase [Burkholderia cepacia]